MNAKHAAPRPDAGLFVFRARRIERLAEVLARRLAADRCAEPMAPVHLSVGSHGMARWLRQQLAARLGIAANLRFLFPAQALELLLGPADAAPPGRAQASSSHALAWAVLAALPEVATRPEFEPLARYLGPRPEGDAVDRRAWALARELGDVLDRYALYRRDWTAAWARGELPAELADSPDAPWQAALWRVATERLGRPSLAERLARHLAGAPPGDCPPLAVFGVSSLPPAYIEALAHQAEATRIELYLLCPSDLYWGDLRRGFREARALIQRPDRERAAERVSIELAGQNPLLTSLGRASRDFQGVLEELAPGYQEPEPDLFEEPEPPRGLLDALQADIQSLRAPAPLSARPAREDDDSFRIHACSGPTRQAEALRETLLALFADHPRLEPRDVVVMTPALETFSPLVGAVFARQAEGSPAIPLAVDDRSALGLNPLAEMLVRLLELGSRRVTARAVMDLLALGPVRRRFDLSAEDLALSARLVSESGVRWAVDGLDRTRAGLPPSELNTWRFGLQRLALGAAMPDEGALWAGCSPLDEMEGERLELFGRLAEAVERLFAALEALRAPRELSAWVRALESTLQSLGAVEDEDAWLGEALSASLADLAADGLAAGCGRPLEAAAMLRILNERLAEPTPFAPPTANAVTLCALKPMRSVPCPVVCVLGLDDGAFPRVAAQRDFDLIRRLPRPGDRDLRDEDRHLLLEALLAARAHLHLFYTARDVHTGVELPPAVPLRELWEAAEATLGGPEEAERARLVEVHPLQPFDARLFGAAPRSFDSSMRAAAARLLGPREPIHALFPEGARLKAEEREALELDGLAAFLEHPVRSLLRTRLGLWLEGDEEVLEDRAPVELGFLEAWRLGQEALSLALAGAPPDTLPARVERLARARGELPPGGAGSLAVRQAWEPVRALLEASAGPRAQPREVVDLSLPALAPGLPPLSARVPGVGPAGDLLALTPSALDGGGRKVLLRTWLGLLALEAREPRPGRLALVYSAGGELRSLGPPGDARSLLAELVALFVEGRCRPLRLTPRASWAFVQALGAHGPPPGQPPEEALRRATDAVEQAWASDERTGAQGEDADAYLRLAFGPRRPFAGPRGGLHPEFVALARTVWGPLAAPGPGGRP
jgi:exodeoxyribonuclease V gamma subunit